MSKIQKALQNIQAKGGPPKRAASGDANNSAVHTNEELDQTIVTPALDRRSVTLEWDELRRGGLIPPEDVAEQLARQIRDIKRPLIGNAFGRRATRVADGNLVMVTSALSGEGKTFMTFNLALSMAQEQDHSVVMIDADVAKPHTSELFGLQNETGLLDILEHPDVPVESAIFDTDVPKLSVLAAGIPRRNSTELLASSRMERLIRQLASADANRIILFDTPPLLQTSESRVLASFVGQIVLVVGAGKTPTGAVAEAVDLLGEEKVVNLVLNMSSTHLVGSRPGYGSLYGSSAVPDE